MKRFSFIIAIVAALAVSTVYAANGSEGIELTGDRPSGSGSIIGTSGGSFDYYWFNYVGGSQEVVVTINVNHSHLSMGNGIGFNLYDDGGVLVGRGQPPRDNQASTYARLPFTRIAGGRILIQVYNYLQGAGVDYTIDVAGLGPASVPQVTGATQPQDAPVLRPQDDVLAGTLEGNPGGAFRYYDLIYPGGNLELSAKLSSTPIFPWSDRAVGMHLYAGDVLVASSSEIERTANTVAHSLQFRALHGGALTLQVYNYGTDHDISYTLFLEGTVGPPTAASGNHSPETAYQVTTNQNGILGSVTGSRGGSFSYFNIPHPGGWKTITISLRIDREDRALESLTGFNIYEGGRLTVQRFTSRDHQGLLVARTTIKRGEPTNLGFQLFNYNEGVTLSYRIDVFGLSD